MRGSGRVGLYYCPRADDPLYDAGASWLGRDPATGEARAHPPFPDIEAVTADARVYGFHATLKAPMRLADGCTWNGMMDAVEAVARRIAPFALPSLAVMGLDGFLALFKSTACPPLRVLADACIEELDPFRAPLTEAELARRRQMPMTPAQAAMLERFGYPFALDTWFFHMTLSCFLSPDDTDLWRPRAERFFAASAGVSRIVSDICVFTQAEPGAPFVIAERVPLTG